MLNKKCFIEICWAREIFRDLLMTADEIFMKMGKKILNVKN